MGGAPSILELWYQALPEPFGIVVPTNSPERLKAKLYSVRKNANDPQLAELMILTSPGNPDGEIWIAHRHVELGAKDV